MTTTLDDIAYEMAMQEQYLDDLHNKNIDKFTEDRLRSYFLSNPNVIQTSVKTLELSKSLFNNEYFTPALIYAAITQEVIVKNILLKGIVYGLVNNDAAAAIITSFTIKNGSPSRFKTMIFNLLKEHGGIDFNNYRRTNSKQALWEEMNKVIENRNSALHYGKLFTSSDAQFSIIICEEILNIIFPSIISTLGLHLHEYTICNCQTSPNTGDEAKRNNFLSLI